MRTSILFLLLIAVLISFAIAYYQYLYKNQTKRKLDFLLFGFRGLSISLLFLLLINPKIKAIKIINEKPMLAILLDNSSSIAYFNEQLNSKTILNSFKENNALQNKFELQYFSFGKEISLGDSLAFNSNQTNISNGIRGVNELHKDKKSALVIVTDGNQTLGNDYEFVSSKNSIYPIAIGDTAQLTDIRITKINANRYSYLKNQFPVETFLFYEGNETITTQFRITNQGKVVFRENLSFSPTERTKTITTNLTSTAAGINYYTASIHKIKGEKNTRNNTKSFAIEVINEQTNILILASFLHPDIGALKKAIESNKQRKVDVVLIDDFKNNTNDYQLVIAYQPNNKFASFFKEVKEKNINYLLVSGAQTDWRFINKLALGFSKKAINQTEEYNAIFNDKFLTFVQNDIGFSDFPPLKDKFGEISFNKETQTLLYQNINDISSNQPLLSTILESDQKIGVLFGEGIWRWRSASFLKQNNFRDFDDFISNLMQFLAFNKKRNRLEVAYKNLYIANETVGVSAFYVDENYQFDKRANLWFSYTNLETNKTKKLPFTLKNNAFNIALEGLASGEYKFMISVDNQIIKKYGKFRVSEYNVEEQFTNANAEKLAVLAKNNNGKLYYPSEVNTLINDLIIDKQYFTTQKSVVILQNLIDWKWILIFVISLLSLEWFIRKYNGKI